MRDAIIVTGYLAASALFIVGLKGLTHPRTAVRGNLLGAGAMALAVMVTLLDRRVLGGGLIAAGVVAGSAIGALLAMRIRMTAMPQLVAAFNGLGGLASTLVAGAAVLAPSAAVSSAHVPGIAIGLATAAAGLVGTVTFWGSLVAFAKLQDLIREQAMYSAGFLAANTILVLGALTLAFGVVAGPDQAERYWLLVGAASLLGVTMVLPIGGADMPVIVALLNSYSGLAAAATGFVLMNNVLIIAGALVGASGLILTRLMCKAMNRSLSTVILGIGGSTVGPAVTAEDVYAGRVKSTTPDEVALLLDGARRVVIVPGYGMAVAQAQHAVAELARWLGQHGVDVVFGIHPVAGRMPGHMNVLLAEANVPYEKLQTIEEVNPTFDYTDVVLINGANDIVNPLARTETPSLITGMPILDVDKARSVVVIKRSLSPGFAGVHNPLFAADNVLMLFGDGKQMVVETISALKAL